MLFQGLRELPSDGEHRIEGGHRLLEDHGDFPAADFSHLLPVQPAQVPAAEKNSAAHDPPRRVRDELKKKFEEYAAERRGKA